MTLFYNWKIRILKTRVALHMLNNNLMETYVMHNRRKLNLEVQRTYCRLKESIALTIR